MLFHGYSAKLTCIFTIAADLNPLSSTVEMKSKVHVRKNENETMFSTWMAKENGCFLLSRLAILMILEIRYQALFCHTSSRAQKKAAKQRKAYNFLKYARINHQRMAVSLCKNSIIQGIRRASGFTRSISPGLKTLSCSSSLS